MEIEAMSNFFLTQTNYMFVKKGKRMAIEAKLNISYINAPQGT